MNRTVLLAVLTSVLCMSLVGVGWAENIAFIIPEGFVQGLADPINDPADKEEVYFAMEVPEPGVFAAARRLESQGHVVNFYGAESDDPETVIADNDLIFIPEANSSGNVITGGVCDYFLVEKPVITSESYLLDEFFVTTTGGSYTARAHATRLKVVDPNHPITQGLPESFIATVTDPSTGEPVVTDWATARNEATLVDMAGHIVVSIDGPAPAGYDPEPPDDSPVVIVVDTGEESIWGEVFLAPFILAGFSDYPPLPEFGADPDSRCFALLNETGWQLWDNIINWALGKPTLVEQWEIH